MISVGSPAPKEPMPPRLLYVVTEDWYFLSHRLPMARAARDAGFDVHVATRVSDGAAAIAAEGLTLHPVPFVRGTLSPGAFVNTVMALRRIHDIVQPAIAHHVALQAAVLGSAAAIGKDVASINALTGFGYAFTSKTFKARAIRPLLGGLLRLLLNRRRTIALVQNPDDQDALTSLGVAADHIALIPGSGVDVDVLRPLPEPTGPITIGFAGRLLEDKGIHTLVAAQRSLRQRRCQTELLVAGTPDPANPTSVTGQQLDAWHTEPGITWLGHVDNIAGFWARVHIAVLASRREGMPKSLLEAAACGRPLIATDVPGCRDVVIPDKTGLLVPVDDPSALADAIEKLAASPELRTRYGAAARQSTEMQFAAHLVGRQTVALYQSLLPPGRQLAAVAST